jgi:hypothetical protein
MNFYPAKIWKPTDDIWDLCDLVKAPESDNVPFYLRGIFSADLIDIESGELVENRIAPNKVLQSVYAEIIGGAHPKTTYNAIAVGTSNVPPHTGQTTLYGMANVQGGAIAYPNGAANSAPYTVLDASPGPFSWSYTSFWPSNAGNGTLWEVGLTNGVTFLNRALFLNNQGTPAFLAKDSGQFMRITVQVRFNFTRL